MISSHSPSGALEARVAVLERQAQRWRRATLTIALVAAGWPLLAFQQGAPPGELICKSLTIVDETGKTVGTWGSTGPGKSKLVLRDAADQERIALTIEQSEIVALLRDSQGQKRLGLAVDGADHPHLVVSDRFSRPKIHMAVSQQGAPTILLRASDGSSPAGIGITAEDKAWVLPGVEPGLPQPKSVKPQPPEAKVPPEPEPGKKDGKG